MSEFPSGYYLAVLGDIRQRRIGHSSASSQLPSIINKRSRDQNNFLCLLAWIGEPLLKRCRDGAQLTEWHLISLQRISATSALVEGNPGLQSVGRETRHLQRTSSHQIYRVLCARTFLRVFHTHSLFSAKTDLLPTENVRWLPFLGSIDKLQSSSIGPRGVQFAAV